MNAIKINELVSQLTKHMISPQLFQTVNEWAISNIKPKLTRKDILFHIKYGIEFEKWNRTGDFTVPPALSQILIDHYETPNCCLLNTSLFDFVVNTFRVENPSSSPILKQQEPIKFNEQFYDAINCDLRCIANEQRFHLNSANQIILDQDGGTSGFIDGRRYDPLNITQSKE